MDIVFNRLAKYKLNEDNFNAWIGCISAAISVTNNNQILHKDHFYIGL